MATVNPTVTDVKASVPTKLVKWAALANGDKGAPVSFPDYWEMTVQADGTFGTGGSVTLKGSNHDDDADYLALTDPQGNAITKTAAGIELVSETPLYIKPHVTAGDGTTAVDVTLLLRRGSR